MKKNVRDPSRRLREKNVLFLFIKGSNWLIRSSKDVILSRKRWKAFLFRNFYSNWIDRSIESKY